MKRLLLKRSIIPRTNMPTGASPDRGAANKSGFSQIAASPNEGRDGTALGTAADIPGSYLGVVLPSIHRLHGLHGFHRLHPSKLASRRLKRELERRRVPLVGLNGRKLVPGLQGFCHGAVPLLICSMSSEATFLTKASLFISLTQSPLRSHEHLRRRAHLRQMPPFPSPPPCYSQFRRLVSVRYSYS
jgi:hypothetical protein